MQQNVPTHRVEPLGEVPRLSLEQSKGNRIKF